VEHRHNYFVSEESGKANFALEHNADYPTGAAQAPPTPRQTFPQTPQEMDELLGFPGTRLPDYNPQTLEPLPGRNRIDWNITTQNGDMRITWERVRSQNAVMRQCA